MTIARALALRVGTPLLAALLALTTWQLYASLSGIRESTLPGPAQVFSALYTDRQLLADNAWVTIGEILAGYAASAVLGVGLAVVKQGPRGVLAHDRALSVEVPPVPVDVVNDPTLWPMEPLLPVMLPVSGV